MINRDQLTALSQMKNYKVSNDDPDVRGWAVTTPAGEQVGTVHDLLIDPSRMKVEYFAVNSPAGGDDILVPAASAQLDATRRHVLVAGLGSFETSSRGAGYGAAATESDRARLTIAEEELRVGTREVDAGEVVVAKHVETEHVSQEVPLHHERVRVERRPVSDVRGAVDIGADEIRIPVIEEEVVVEKRAVVKEEIVISKERVTETERVDADVRRERVDVTGGANLVADDIDALQKRGI